MEASIPEPGSGIVFRPEVGASYGNAWKQLWKNFGSLIVIWIIAVIFGAVASLIQWSLYGFDAAAYLHGPSNLAADLFSWAFSILVGTPISVGIYYAYLRAARGEDPELSDMFRGFKNYLSAVVAPVLVSIIVSIGTLLLIIPGIILGCRLAFVPFLITDRKLGIADAISGSWEMTKGHAMKVFLIYLLGIPITIGGLICLIVGVIPAGMWIYMALASLYHAILLQIKATP